MKIQKLIVENYKAIRGRKELTPNGASFFLLGGNGVGKTSFGHAIHDMLTGHFPSKPITEGEHAGGVEITFDNNAKLIMKLIEGKKPIIEFITSDGFNAGSSKDIFSRLAGEGMTFNIDDFLKLAPKPLREKLEKIAGLDLTDLNTKEKQAFDERTLAKAQLRDQQGRVQPYDVSLVTKQPDSPVEISNKIQAITVDVNAYKKEEEKEALLTAELAKGNANITIMEDELNDYIKHAKAKIAGVVELVEATRQALNDQRDKLKNVLIKPDESQIEVLNTQLSEVEKTNKAIADAQRLHKEFEIAQQLELKVADLESQVKVIRDAKEAKIKASPIPAEGVTFSDIGDILIDGLPFTENQISTSRKIIAGIQIAASMLKDIKYLHFDGAALDHENADKVLDYAEKHGLQLCIERPLWEGGELTFEIHDHTAMPQAATA